MKLVYIDPYCSGLQVIDCISKEDIKNELSKYDMNEENCDGEVINYAFIDKNGNEFVGRLDFT